MQKQVVALILLALLVGCDSTSKVEEPVTRTIANSAAAVGSASAAPRVPINPLTDKEVRDVVDRWLNTQNEADFKGYSELFATRFIGVKRVGEKTRHFGREDWLKDRQGMFKHSFTVSIDNLQVTTDPGSAVVQFTQTWSSASYQDEGPKRLIIIKEGDRARISSEEMLKSEPKDGKTGLLRTTNPREFAFVGSPKGDIVLLRTLSDLNAVTGHPVYVSDTQASRGLDAKLLPAADRSLLGETFKLYGAAGEVCQAKVSDLFVHVSAEPHFGTSQHWEGDAGLPKTAPAQRAVALWRLSKHGGRFLAAQLASAQSCKGAIWARSAALRPAEVWSKRQPDPTERSHFISIMRGDSEYMKLQAAYQETFKKQGWWDETSRPLKFDVFENGKGSLYASITLSASIDDSCSSDFDPDLWVLLRKHDKTYEVVSAPPDAHVHSQWPRYLDPLSVEAAFDLDHDGVPEFASSTDLVKSVKGQFRAVYNLSPGYFSCPC